MDDWRVSSWLNQCHENSLIPGLCKGWQLRGLVIEIQIIAICCCMFQHYTTKAPFSWLSLVVEQSFQVPQVCGVMVGVPSSGWEPQHEQAPTAYRE